jgi:hypothetical protein
VSGGVTPAAGGYTPRTRDAIEIEFVEAPGGDTVVEMRVPMDGDTEAERFARAEWCGDDRDLRVRSKLTLDLNGERRQLVAHLAKVYVDPDFAPLLQNPLAPVDPLLAQRAMQPLAVAGAGVFRALFAPEEYLDPVSGEDARVAAAVDAALHRPGRVHVRCARDPLFPWPFVYDDLALRSAHGAGAVKLERFWGFVHELQTEPALTAGSVRIAAPLRVLASACPTVDPAGRSRSAAHPLASLAPTWIDDVADLGKALRALDCDALYVLGHASHDASPAASTSQLLYEGAPLTVSDLLGGGGTRGKSRPVLFFHNACESAPLDRWDNNTVPGFVLDRHKGRVCLLGTAAQVPRAVAVAFAERFWERFRGGATLGASVRESRAALLADFHNPLGLLYALHGKADTRIVTEGAPTP